MIEECSENYLQNRKLLLKELKKLVIIKRNINKKIKTVQHDLELWDRVLLYEEV